MKELPPDEESLIAPPGDYKRGTVQNEPEPRLYGTYLATAETEDYFVQIRYPKDHWSISGQGRRTAGYQIHKFRRTGSTLMKAWNRLLRDSDNAFATFAYWLYD
jgi:hypothetical protein